MTRAVRLFVNNWLASAKALPGARPRRRRQRTKHVAVGKWISEDFQRQQREPTSGRSWPAEPSCGRECRQDRRRKGSLTAAANALDTSLPTVVRILASLERHLGVTLLHRTTRRIRLTEEGALYLERCRVILSATHEAEETLIAREAELRGNLTVGAPVLFGRRYVAPVVNDFLRRHPKVTIDLRFGDRVLNLGEEHVDVAVRIAHLKDSSLVAMRPNRSSL